MFLLSVNRFNLKFQSRVQVLIFTRKWRHQNSITEHVVGNV